MDSNINSINSSGVSATTTLSPRIEGDQTGLFIGLFLLFLLFLLISYLFYSFISFKRFHDEQMQMHPSTTLNESKLDPKLISTDHENLILHPDEDNHLPRQSSFSDCGTSIRSSSIRSHRNAQCKRSSSYRLCSQPSNYLLTPRVSSQFTNQFDECLSSTIIIEPNDIQSANALSRSISKYYERQRKENRLKRRIHSCEDLTNSQLQLNGKRRLQPTVSLPMRPNSRPIDRLQPTDPKQRSTKKKPTTIYELYKSDRMRISNLLIVDP